MASEVEVCAICDPLREVFSLGRVYLQTFEAETNVPHQKKFLSRFYVDGSVVVDPALRQWTKANDEVYNLLELQPRGDSSADSTRLLLRELQS